MRMRDPLLKGRRESPLRQALGEPHSIGDKVFKACATVFGLILLHFKLEVVVGPKLELSHRKHRERAGLSPD